MVETTTEICAGIHDFIMQDLTPNAGAVTGAVFLPRIRRRLATENVLAAGTAAFAFATLILGISKNLWS